MSGPDIVKKMTRLVTRPFTRRPTWPGLFGRVGPVALVAALALWLAPARRAFALGEEEWAASLSVAGGLLGARNDVAAGAGGGLEIARGLTDVFAARAALSMERFAWPAIGPRSPVASQALAVTAGGVAAFDVLRVVPFVELSLVVAHFSGGAMGPRAGAELGVGADYLLDRRWSVGGVIRGRLLPVPLDAQEGSLLPSGAMVVRLGRKFWF
jgi:hypothetical protein